ncbi:GntR family transcriptional regulator [Alkaliphilus peptidifermentans]|uniref:Transcriptional regulator, GntR family n=1 Tax=Alkaliphilus peptidifermentans DSM 18978 TaxID=1120976 RepID=A0A1G5KHS7_9FIRM|nr:GntR family transcriptional regulator [Alkaliphilus peptidifermentans]SCZ00126.1 transcriptional regulator, GntR family [Alkaliphilus peptidifermentans DSM 18978]
MSNLQNLKIESFKPLREIVFENLREAILEGKLEPGQRMMEIQLAEQLGVSRTPVREAIRKLELEGLVIMVPRKGAYVADVSIKDIMEVLEIRAVLEGLAASLAAERMTDEELDELEMISYQFKRSYQQDDVEGMIEKDIEFHERIFNSARNEKLVQIAQGLREQIYRFRVTYISEYNKAKELVEEHQAILETISQRDAEKAYEVAAKHIENAGSHMMESVLKGKGHENI